jgi:hypothetical protein
VSHLLFLSFLFGFISSSFQEHEVSLNIGEKAAGGDEDEMDD